MKLRISMMMALLALANIAVAQERRTPGQERPGQAGQERPAVRQDEEGRAQREVTRRGGREAGEQTAHAGSLNQFVAAGLIIANQEEIQLNQFAMDKIQNEQAKQFAQKMIQDHQKFVEKLQQIVPGEVSSDLQFTSVSTGQDAGADQQQPVEQGADSPRESNQRKPSEQREGAQTPDAQRSTERQVEAGRTGAAGQQDQADVHLTAVVITRGAPMHRLLMIERSKAQHCLTISQKQLEEAQASEVDQVYLGQQVAAHVGMLATLRALEGEVDGELQQLVSQGEKSTQEHLQMAEKLMKQIGSSNAQSGQDNNPESDRPESDDTDSNN